MTIPATAHTRADFVRQGWLLEDESPLLRRLVYGQAAPSAYLTREGLPVRDRILDEMADGTAHPRKVTDCLAQPGTSGTTADVLVAETDRFGIPLRTVVSPATGLMRSDPYYDKEYLGYFYRDHYRTLYRKHSKSHSRFFREQIQRGEAILSGFSAHLPATGRVLDFGCGMGGSLVPFALAGWEILGCDYGKEYVELGRRAGLNLRRGGHDDVADDGPFDLLILSHVLEHVVEPVTFLQSLRDLLSDDGQLFIAVPGLLSVESNRGGDLLSYLQNAHVWHFTSATLGALLGRAGFQVVQLDEEIRCLARPGANHHSASIEHGTHVLQSLEAMDRRYQRRCRFKEPMRWGRSFWRAVRGCR